MFTTVRYNGDLQLCYSVDKIICESDTAIDIRYQEFVNTENPLDTAFELFIDSLANRSNGVLCNGVKNTPWGTVGYIFFAWGMLEVQQSGSVNMFVNHLREGVVIETCI